MPEAFWSLPNTSDRVLISNQLRSNNFLKPHLIAEFLRPFWYVAIHRATYTIHQVSYIKPNGQAFIATA